MGTEVSEVGTLRPVKAVNAVNAVNAVSSRWDRRLSMSLLVVLAALSACGLEQAHGYVQSSDGSLSFRRPAQWVDVGLEAVSTEWVAGIDASPSPSAGNLGVLVLDAPFVVAQVYPIDPEVRDTVTRSRVHRVRVACSAECFETNEAEIEALFESVRLRP
ncbi:MAG: hypothetical protein ACFCVK_05195 [Acidimicrobiales bacterium]